MRIQVGNDVEEYDISFLRKQDGTIEIGNPSIELLASLIFLSQVPVNCIRIPPVLADAEAYIVARCEDEEIDDTYGENEYVVDVTYSPHELYKLRKLFDQNA